MRRQASRRLRRAGALLGASLREFFADRCPLIAAAISYYALFSIFPIAILVVIVFGLVADDAQAREEVVDFIMRNLPLKEGEGRRELSDLLERATAAGAGLGAVALFGVGFAASGLMGAIRGAVNTAWGVEHRRPPLQGKLLDILLVLGVGAVIVLSLGLTLLVRVSAGLGRDMGDALGGAGGVLGGAVLALGQLVPLVITALVFLFLFRVLPALSTTSRDVWPGVLVAALGYEAAKIGFAFYLDNFARYDAVYGSLGVVIAFLVFVFVAANLFLLGAEAASEWPRVRSAPLDEEGPPWRQRATGLLRKLVVREPRQG